MNRREVAKVIGTSSQNVDYTEHLALRKLWRLGLPINGISWRNTLREKAMLQVAMREVKK